MVVGKNKMKYTSYNISSFFSNTRNCDILWQRGCCEASIQNGRMRCGVNREVLWKIGMIIQRLIAVSSSTFETLTAIGESDAVLELIFNR